MSTNSNKSTSPFSHRPLTHEQIQQEQKERMHDLIRNAKPLGKDEKPIISEKEAKALSDKLGKVPAPEASPVSHKAPTAQETLDAIDEVKQIAGKYGYEENWAAAKPELKAVA